MIVKEMYSPTRGADGRGSRSTPASWTVMIKDAKGSKDGWFWGGLGERSANAETERQLQAAVQRAQ